MKKCFAAKEVQDLIYPSYDGEDDDEKLFQLYA